MKKKDQSNAKEKHANLPIPPAGKETKSNTNLTEGETQNPTDLQEPPKPRWFRDKDKRESALIFATIILAAFTGWMAWETHQLGKDSKIQAEASQMSARAAIIADSISDKTLQLAQRNFRIENRPYVGIKNVTIDSFQVNKQYIIKIYYQNYGKTPALNLQVFGQTEGHTVLNYVGFNFDKTLMSAATLPPAENLNASFISGVKSSSEFIEGFLKSQYYLYVVGMITYTDVFGGRDTTTFCHIMNAHDKSFWAGPYFNQMK